MHAVVPGADDLPAVPAGTATPAAAATTTAPASSNVHSLVLQGEETDVRLPGTPTTVAGAAPAADLDATAKPAPAAAVPATPATPAASNVHSLALQGEETDVGDTAGKGTTVAPAASTTGASASAPALPAAPAGAGQPAVPATPAAPAVPTLPPATAEAWVSRGLAHTVERIADLAHVATARGVARARLQLHPQELGGIEVRLRQSAEGLVAMISASRGDGHEALQQTAGELRRSLEERGITIARLDIELSARGDGQRPWQRDGHSAAEAPASARSREVRGIEGTDDDGAPVDTTPTSTPAGVLVDVHA